MLDASMSQASHSRRERGSVLAGFKAASRIVICLLAAPLLAASSACIVGSYDTGRPPTFSPDGRRAVSVAYRDYRLGLDAHSWVFSTDAALHHWTITDAGSWKRIWVSRGGPPKDRTGVWFSPDSRYVAFFVSGAMFCMDLETNEQTRLSPGGLESFVWTGPREIAYVTADVDPDAPTPAFGWPRNFWRLAIGDPPSKRVLIHRDENCLSECHYSWSPRGTYIVVRPTKRAPWRCIRVQDSRISEFGETSLETYYAKDGLYVSSLLSGVSWAPDESRVFCLGVYAKGNQALILDPLTEKVQSFAEESLAVIGGAKSLSRKRDCPHCLRMLGLEAEWSQGNEYLILSHMGRLVNPDTWEFVDVPEELNRRFPSQGPFHSVIRRLSAPGWLLVLAKNGHAYFTDFHLKELRDLEDCGITRVLYDFSVCHGGNDRDVASWVVSPDGSRSTRGGSMKTGGWEIFRLKSVPPPITGQDHP